MKDVIEKRFLPSWFFIASMSQTSTGTKTTEQIQQIQTYKSKLASSLMYNPQTIDKKCYTFVWNGPKRVSTPLLTNLLGKGITMHKSSS